MLYPNQGASISMEDGVPNTGSQLIDQAPPPPSLSQGKLPKVATVSGLGDDMMCISFNERKNEKLGRVDLLGCPMEISRFTRLSKVPECEVTGGFEEDIV